MNGRENYIQLKIWSLPALLLYSLFFTVQVFFNFDNPNSSTSSGHQQTTLVALNGQYAQAISGHSNHGKRSASKIRLNKRFQPACSPGLIPFYVTAPVIFIEKPLKTVYPAPFHSSPCLFTRALRGPPARVYQIV